MADRADWCKMKIKVTEIDKSGKINYEEDMDGKLNEYEGRSDGDKYKVEDDPGDKRNCMWDKTATTLGLNGTIIQPVLAWTKGMDTGDDNDNMLVFKDNLTVVFEIESGSKFNGMAAGFYLDDPWNPVIVVETGAKTLAAGVLSAAALVYATL
jgi:hypothetical protein